MDLKKFTMTAEGWQVYIQIPEYGECGADVRVFLR